MKFSLVYILAITVAIILMIAGTIMGYNAINGLTQKNIMTNSAIKWRILLSLCCHITGIILLIISNLSLITTPV